MLTITHRRYRRRSSDTHGNPVVEYDDEALAVYAVYPRTSLEPVPGRPLVATGWAVLAPAGTDVGPHDLLVIDGVEWRVVGHPADWGTGPFGWDPGVEIVIERAEG